ncbi:membrane protein [Methyloceanibacter caenitepidi]|uniref:Threonine dehydrogenase and related Zn-dependent dehydrogenases n=1 Tax=Methyloceanibacter caenitepidi TaxID=1384459 RepID=A0A0A8K5E9_9HYPH|nr:membrane protein [Methyloceanibacter caenitepidi]BAQ18173.1 threonine dehydrogenase and related Zn-dependent dehydrogenases [Methyloceanibacter caenitepidi]
MNWSITFVPFVPWPALWIVAGIGAVLLALLFWRARRGAVLRLLTFAALLMALANPHLKREDREPLNDIVTVVVDDSQSQTLAGRTARTAELRNALEERLKEVPDLETRVVRSGSSTDEPDRDGTMLFTDLGQALADVPPDRLAGVIMITDGQVHDVPEKVAALGFDAPVHALLTGKDDEFDRRLEVIAAPRFGIVGSTQTVEVRVSESKPREDDITTLTITQQGKEPEKEIVRIGAPVEIPVDITHAGPNIVEIKVDGAEGELTEINNRVLLPIEGVRENLRVLLVSGEPHAGERTWRNMLKSDASVDLVHFTILRPPEKQDGTPINQLSLIAFPTRELFQEKLDQFDLIIFDRYQRRGVLPLLYLENVARYVERGGAVLVSSGDDYASPLSLYRTPLGSILPAAPSGRVVERPYRPALSELGAKHPVTGDLAGARGGGEDGTAPTWGRWFRVVDVSPRDAEVLMTGADDRPLLVIGERGKGRVAVLLSDQAWLWARGYDGGGPYSDLLRRLAHWLMKEPELEQETLRASSKGQSLIIERRSIEDEIDPVVVTTPSGEEMTVTLDKGERGIWRKVIQVDEHGVYRVASGELASLATVGKANTREFAAVTASTEPLAPVLEGTGGGAFWMGREEGAEESLPRLAMIRSGRVMHGADWLGLHKRDAYHVKGVRLFPLFSGFLALALLLGLLAAAWYREGR